jgi:uncharacterized membrane protein
MLKRLVLILAVLVMFASFAYAADIKTYSNSFNIVGANVVVQTDVIFNNKTTKTLEFQLPDDYEALSAYIDSNPVKADVNDNLLKINLNQNTKVSFNYVTSEFIDRDNFLVNLEQNYDADNLLIKLALPEGATLKKPIKEGDLTSGSIYPKPTDSKTDGRSLIFYWLKTDVKQGDETSIFVQFESRKFPVWVVALIVLLVAAGAVLLVLYLRKKSETKIIIEKEDLVEKHLKEDEEQIVNVLKLKGGQCEQGTLRIATGFSKATLSRLLSELEERNVVSKEKRGKKNLVFLKK